MTGYVFEFDLERNNVSKDSGIRHAVRYYRTEDGIWAEIGDGYRHEIKMEGKYWDRILKIIKNDELDYSGIKALIRGLMRAGLRQEFEENFLNAIKEGKIKSSEEFV